MSVFQAAAAAPRAQDDFYGFVNASWRRTTPIPASSSYVSDWLEAERRLREKLHALLDALPDSHPAAGVWRAARDDGSSRGALALFEEAMAISDWPERVALLHASGAEPFFSLKFFVDSSADGQRTMLFAVQGGLSLPDSAMYGDTELVSSLRAHIGRVFSSFLGLKDAGARAERVLDFERELAKAHRSAAQRRGQRYAVRPLASLLDDGGVAAAFLRAIIGDAKIASDRVATEPGEYFDTVMALARGHPAVEDYVAWVCARHAMARDGHQAYEQHWCFFGRDLVGEREPEDARRQRVEVFCETFPEAAAEVYVASDPEGHRERRAIAEGVVRSVAESMARRLVEGGGSAAISAETRALCAEKLRAMRVMVGYPDEPHPHGAKVLRAGAEAAGRGWWPILMAASRRRFRLNVEGLGRPRDPALWESMHAHTVNACYDPSVNSITIPAAILGCDMFDLSTPVGLFSSIGVIVGHEITHGFDDQGRHYDSQGRTRPWWSAADVAAFREACAALDAQLRSQGLVPKLTRGEAIADIVGLRAALGALGTNDPATLRAFFCTWGRLWRIRMTRKRHRMCKLIDPHATGRARTHVPLQNIPEFYEAFSVGKNDGMYVAPERRVVIF